MGPLLSLIRAERESRDLHKIKYEDQAVPVRIINKIIFPHALILLHFLERVKMATEP